MPKQPRSLYPDYKKIWIFGMRYTGADGQFLKGLVRYRGRTRKWLIRNIDYPLDDHKWLKEERSKCDLLVGRIYQREHADFFASIGKPVIDLSNLANHPSFIPSHNLDYRAGGAMAAKYLRQLGHRNFAFITYCAYSSGKLGPSEQLAWEGFSEELANDAASLQLIQRIERKCLVIKPVQEEQPLESVSAWLRKMERPMGLLVFEDWMGQEICQFSFFSNVSIPEDLSVIGMHNDPLVCETCLPSLTSIAYPGEYWGMRVAAHIDDLFSGKTANELELIPPSTVVPRNSTALEIIDDELVARGLSLLRHHANSRLNIREVLSELPISLRAFQIRFRKAIGRTPLEELFRIRVDLARQQLVETHHTVDRIAEDCGFRHAESMAQYFKKWTGVTPTEYRRKNQFGN